jgi:surfactin synthase thioesterase subunit
VIKPADAMNLIAFFPAAGSGGTTLEQLEKLAIRRGLALAALSNPASIDVVESGQWQAESIDEILSAVDHASVSPVILVGHCMGGLSAIRLSGDLCSRLARPVRVLLVNTPCPDSGGRIPTMSHFTDAEIAQVLAHDGFPPEVLDDEDMLAEVADGLREEAKVADRLAEWVSSARDLETLYVLSTRGDTFSSPEVCAGWRHRVSGELQLTIAPGGHSLDEKSINVLERAIDSVIAAAQAELA